MSIPVTVTISKEDLDEYLQFKEQKRTFPLQKSELETKIKTLNKEIEKLKQETLVYEYSYCVGPQEFSGKVYFDKEEIFKKYEAAKFSIENYKISAKSYAALQDSFTVTIKNLNEKLKKIPKWIRRIFNAI